MSTSIDIKIADARQKEMKLQEKGEFLPNDIMLYTLRKDYDAIASMQDISKDVKEICDKAKNRLQDPKDYIDDSERLQEKINFWNQLNYDQLILYFTPNSEKRNLSLLMVKEVLISGQKELYNIPMYSAEYIHAQQSRLKEAIENDDIPFFQSLIKEAREVLSLDDQEFLNSWEALSQQKYVSNAKQLDEYRNTLAKIETVLASDNGNLDQIARWLETAEKKLREMDALVDSSDVLNKCQLLSMRVTKIRDGIINNQVDKEFDDIEAMLGLSSPDFPQTAQKLNELKQRHAVLDPIRFQKLEKVYVAKHLQYVEQLRQELAQTRVIIDDIVKKEDLDKYLEYREKGQEPLGRFISLLGEMEQINPQYPDLGKDKTYKQDMELQLKEFAEFALLNRELKKRREEIRKAESTENYNYMVNLLKNTCDLIVEEQNKFKRLEVNTKVQDLYNKIRLEYDKARSDHEIPLTMSSQAVDLQGLIRMFKLRIDKGEGAEKVTFYVDPSTSSASAMTIKNALVVAEERLLDVWKKRSEQYIEDAQVQYLGDISKSPSDARSHLQNIWDRFELDQQTWRNESVGLMLPLYLVTRIKSILEIIGKAENVRGRINDCCYQARNLSSLKDAWRLLGDAEKYREEEKQVRRLLDLPVVTELDEARKVISGKTQQRIIALLNDADANFDKGLIEQVDNKLKDILELQEYLPVVDEVINIRISRLHGDLELVRKTLEETKTGDYAMIKARIEALMSYFADRNGGREYVLRWGEIKVRYEHAEAQVREQAEQIAANRRVEVLLLEFETLAQFGGDFEMLNGKLEIQKNIKSLSADHRDRLQKAITGINAWIAVRRAEQVLIGAQQSVPVLEILGAALKFEPTRVLAEDIKHRIDKKQKEDSVFQKQQIDLEKARQSAKSKVDDINRYREEHKYEVAFNLAKKAQTQKDIAEIGGFNFLEAEIVLEWEQYLIEKINDHLSLQNQIFDVPLEDNTDFDLIQQWLRTLQKLNSSQYEEYARKVNFSKKQKSRILLEQKINNLLTENRYPDAIARAEEELNDNDEVLLSLKYKITNAWEKYTTQKIDEILISIANIPPSKINYADIDKLMQELKRLSQSTYDKYQSKTEMMLKEANANKKIKELEGDKTNLEILANLCVEMRGVVLKYNDDLKAQEWRVKEFAYRKALVLKQIDVISGADQKNLENYRLLLENLTEKFSDKDDPDVLYYLGSVYKELGLLEVGWRR